MLLIAYTLLIIYARVGLTPLYSMLVLFVVVERENLNALGNGSIFRALTSNGMDDALSNENEQQGHPNTLL